MITHTHTHTLKHTYLYIPVPIWYYRNAGVFIFTIYKIILHWWFIRVKVFRKQEDLICKVATHLKSVFNWFKNKSMEVLLTSL